MSSMLAFRLTKASDSAPVTALTKIPSPVPVSGQLLIKIHASPLHPSDLLNARGLFPSTTYPRTPGRDFAGTIVAGPDSRIGEEVYGTSGNSIAFTADGAHAEYIVVPETAVARKPKNLSWIQAAVVGVPFTTAAVCLRKAGVIEGKQEVVLVLGANGAVGKAVCQLAAAKGCVVLRATRNDSSDVNTSNDPNLSSLSGRKVDVVIDTVGLPSLTAAAVSTVDVNGRIVVITAPRGGASTEAKIDILDFYRKNKVLVGVNTLLVEVEEMARELDNLRDGFENGNLIVEEEEWTQVRLENASDIYEKAGVRGAGKFVIVFD